MGVISMPWNKPTCDCSKYFEGPSNELDRKVRFKYDDKGNLIPDIKEPNQGDIE